ncbi:MAG: tyrosine-protein phosphatase [Clostridia bacterium]|nr:tyrosine-protein phosphatase [Clostridia bacterium]
MKYSHFFKLISLLLALILLLPLAAACGKEGQEAITTDTEQAATTEPEVTTEEPKPKCTVLLRELEGTVDIHTEGQAKYLAGPYTAVSKYAEGAEELSHPAPIVLRWDLDTESTEIVRRFYVKVGMKPDLSDAVEYRCFDQFYNLYNVFLGATYYWNVTAFYNEGDEYTSATSSFTVTSTPPRNMYVDGVSNVRDLGGWTTEDGGKVRQGLIYRCGRLNKNKSTTDQITYQGKKTMLDVMGVKSELDLRLTENNESGNLTQSPLGKTVTYYAFPMVYSTNKLTSENNPEMIRQIFALLADESNYPIIFHCSIGTDRTGLIAWLINGLLGVSKENLWRDYLYSNFGNIGSSRSMSNIADEYVNILDAAPGSTLSEKIYNYLKGIGIPEEQLNSIIRILKEN